MILRFDTETEIEMEIVIEINVETEIFLALFLPEAAHMRSLHLLLKT